jgi:type II secretory pathway component PulF
MRWIDRPDELAGMLRATGEIFAARVQLQASKLAMVLQPFVLLSVAFFFGLLAVIVYAPFFDMIQLLNDLS